MPCAQVLAVSEGRVSALIVANLRLADLAHSRAPYNHHRKEPLPRAALHHEASLRPEFADRDRVAASSHSSWLAVIAPYSRRSRRGVPKPAEARTHTVAPEPAGRDPSDSDRTGRFDPTSSIEATELLAPLSTVGKRWPLGNQEPRHVSTRRRRASASAFLAVPEFRRAANLRLVRRVIGRVGLATSRGVYCEG